MLSLAVIQSLIADTVGINAALQPSSAVLIGAMWDYLSNMGNWYGAGDELTPTELDEIDAMIGALYSDIATELTDVSNPLTFARIGSIFAVPSAIGQFSETGLIYCNGSTHLRVDYPDLYAMLNAAYIIDADNFKVPDLRGRMLLGNGDGGLGVTYSMAARGGHHQHVLTVAELPAHDHTQRRHSSSAGTLDGVVSSDTTSSTPVETDLKTAQTGSGSAHNNMPPYEVIRWYIVARYE